MDDVDRSMAMNGQALMFGYYNHRGEYSIRHVIPKTVYFGATDYYPAQQWLMLAWDVDRGDYRDFAFANMVMGYPRAEANVAPKFDPYSRS